MNTKQRIEELLRQTLAATIVEVEDESAQHIGHAGTASGGGHYRVTVVSPLFEGKSRVARHRMVYDALAVEMRQTIHALALTTLTPSQQRSSQEPLPQT
jgi:BolA protein